MKCKAEWQHKNIVGPRHHQWTQVERVCEICGQKFFIKRSHLGYKYQGRYCSMKCMAEARRREKIKQWQDPEYRERTIKAALKGLLKRPTSLEQDLIKFFNKHSLPFKYVGDGSFLIGYKNPDFINTDGRKIAIEVRNSFFSKPHYAEKRKAHFAKYGWDCIILETGKTHLTEQQTITVLAKSLKEHKIKL